MWHQGHLHEHCEKISMISALFFKKEEWNCVGVLAFSSRLLCLHEADLVNLIPNLCSLSARNVRSIKFHVQHLMSNYICVILKIVAVFSLVL